MLGAHGKYINRFVKAYDRELFVGKDHKDRLCVFRKRYRYDVMDYDEFMFQYGRPDPEFVFALTDTWSQLGTFIEWGPDQVLSRLRQIDFWDNRKLIEELDRANEHIDESRKKDFRNQCEAMASDWRSAFKKAFDGVNTSTLDKKLDPRRKYDANHK